MTRGLQLHRATGALAATAGPLLVEAIEAQVEAEGRCRLGLSGGSTPAGTLRWLAEHLPAAIYPALRVTWIDERFVPPDHPDSNAGLARVHWFEHAEAQPGVVLRMVEERDTTPDEALQRFRAGFAHDFEDALDVALLGAGPDGHIASLFPGHPALTRPEPVLLITDSPKPPPIRLTLGLAPLRAARRALLLVRGANKAAMVERVVAGDHSLPAGLYRPRGDLDLVVDRDAAARIPPLV